MLATPVPDDDRCIIVASKGGDDRHPDWYHNLRANPEITVEFKNDRFTARIEQLVGRKAG